MVTWRFLVLKGRGRSPCELLFLALCENPRQEQLRGRIQVFQPMFTWSCVPGHHGNRGVLCVCWGGLSSPLCGLKAEGRECQCLVQFPLDCLHSAGRGCSHPHSETVSSWLFAFCPGVDAPIPIQGLFRSFCWSCLHRHAQRYASPVS